MTLLLKQSTAVTLKIGPFLDDSDGNTPETGLTISQGDVMLTKNGGTMAQKNESSSCTHDADGWYDCDLDATDTGTLGRLQLMVHESGALAVWHEFVVLTSNSFNALCQSGVYLDVSVIDLSTEALANFFDKDSGETYSSAISGSVVKETVAGTPTVAGIADGVWDESMTGHDTAGTAGANLIAAGAAAGPSGAVKYTHTVTNAVGGAAIPDVKVWISTDAAGTAIVASGYTDSSGEVVFYLDAGTIYVWKEKAGWNFSNPEQESIS